MTRAEIVAEARAWIGTPWRHQSCLKGAGVDCLHLIAGVGRNVGAPEAARFFDNQEWHNYGREPDPAKMFAGCDALSDRIDPATALPGDALLFAIGGHPMHFGLLTDSNTFIHAYLGARRVVEHRLDDKWRRRIIRAYRFRGVE